MWEPKIIFTHHAEKRCRERKIDPRLVRERLWVFPFREGGKPRKWRVPGTNQYVVFLDVDNTRIVITVYEKKPKGRRK